MKYPETLFDFIRHILSFVEPEKLLEYKMSGNLTKRYLLLAEKNQIGNITSKELDEITFYLKLNDIISLEKVKVAKSTGEAKI